MPARFAVKSSYLIGTSPEMAEVVAKLDELAESEAAVLIEGERGTGRELVARVLHYASARKGGEFVAVNAAAIPRAVLEEELLGGALKRAHGGTLVLKDVSFLPRQPQKKVLAVVQGKGDADVRVIGVSDGDLGHAVEADVFDRGLYEALGAERVAIPPLRRRIADLPRLVRHFLKEVGEAAISVSSRAIDRLAQYPWPGNVGELKDVASRLAVRARRRRPAAIDLSDVDAVLPQLAERVPIEDMSFEEVVRAKLRAFLKSLGDVHAPDLYEDVMARVERPLISLVLQQTGGNQLRAAEVLGLNRNTLRKKLGALGLNEKAGERPGRARRRL